MLGNFQQSQVRIEVDANRQTIADSLLKTTQLRQWMWPQSLSSNLPDTLNTGLTFISKLGLVEVEHQVETADDNCLRLLLSKGIDGYHEWYWGDGWIQSRLEGISLLPLNLGQTFSLLRLRQHLEVESKNKG
jgi:hypothetical protein